MPNCTPILVLLATWLCLGTGSATATPLGRSFTYQGPLQQAGVPVEGTVSLRFSLWDAAGSGVPPAGGSMIGGLQVVANPPVTGGVFSVALNGADEFGPVAFNGDPRWLQVEVCADSICSPTSVLGPRQALTRTPYALGPWQMSGTSLNDLGGKVGIGTTSPAHPLHIKATVTPVVLGDKAIASQQAGYISFQKSTSETGWMGYGTSGSPDMTFANARSSGDIVLWAGGERLRVHSGGNVGIGTSTPASRLEVRGDVRMGSFGEYFAPGGTENLRVIRGKVSAAGSVSFGSGFTASRSSWWVRDDPRPEERGHPGHSGQRWPSPPPRTPATRSCGGRSTVAAPPSRPPAATGPAPRLASLTPTASRRERSRCVAGSGSADRPARSTSPRARRSRAS